MKNDSACLGFVVVSLVASGCGSSSKAKGGDTGADAGNGGADAGRGGRGNAEAGAPKDAVRSSCGDVPILDDAYLHTSDACKTCFDEKCCDQAEACAGKAECRSFWECLATCDAPFTACTDACLAAVGAQPPESAALNACRSTCTDCLDVTSCSGVTPPAPPKDEISIVFACQSYTSAGIVFPGLTVKVCDRADVKCETPLDEGTTGDDGTVTLDVPTAPYFSDAYVEITGQNVFPTRNYLRYAAVKDLFAGNRRLLQRLLDTATASALAGVLGVKTEPLSGEKAFLNAAAASCVNRPVAGVTIESSAADADTVRGYIAGVAPSPTATATDGSGLVAFGDHPEGPTTITVKNADGSVYGSTDAYARAGFLTGLNVLPR